MEKVDKIVIFSLQNVTFFFFFFAFNFWDFPFVWKVTELLQLYNNMSWESVFHSLTVTQGALSIWKFTFTWSISFFYFLFLWILVHFLVTLSKSFIFVVLFSCQVMSDSSWLHGLQPCRLPCPPLSLRIFSSSCPLNCWCHPTISSSVALSSICLQSFPTSGSFPNGLALYISWPKYWSFKCSNLIRRSKKINSICQLMLRYFVYVSLLPSLTSSINIFIF